jgi:spore germination protein YaaH
MKGVVFDFEMTRSKQVAKDFFKDYGGILHTDGYAATHCCPAISQKESVG